MSSDVGLVLMNKDRIFRSLNRMAHEIAEQHTADRPVVLFGIDQRGHAIAKSLGDILQPMFDSEVVSIQLLLKDGDANQSFEEFSKIEVANPFTIVVDDVIFSGQTMFTALKKITEHLDPPEVHTAVLIDRGHRKFPIMAEYYGMELPTKLDEHVAVMVKNSEVEEVVLSNSE